ncbi:MAG: 50S ribosomal protein L19 [Dehalococcoidales bacterium]|nr:50S ribosomal protein L19 [Dehalococcoidales bacterium]
MNTTLPVEVKLNPNIPDLAPGDTVKVNVKVVEGDKERIQPFKGVVIKVRRGVDGGSFTVRRVTRGIGVERTFLFQSPLLEKVEVEQHGKVRRAKLYYLRRRSGKTARLRERRLEKKEMALKTPEAVPEPEPEPEPEPSTEEN